MEEVSNKGTITVKRTSQYVNKIRAFKVYVDEKFIGNLKNGETIDVEVESGRHEVYVTLDSMKSEEIVLNVEEGENKWCTCGSPLTGFKIFLASFYMFKKHGFLFLREGK